MADLVSFELRDGVALVTMDDGKANALSHDMLDGLTAAFDRAEQEARAVVLAGRAGRFSAGFDLTTMMSGIDAATRLVSAGAELYLRMYGFPLPVVAACTGHAMAGGALLLLSSDTRLGAEGAFKIGLNEVAIGLRLPVLAQELARDRLSKRHLTAATIQARIYDPTAAVDAGYLDATAPADQLIAQAVDRARQLAALPQAPYAGTKQVLRGRTIAYIRDTLAGDMAAMTPR